MRIDWTDRDTHRRLNAALNGVYGIFNLGASLVVLGVFGAIGAICVLAGLGTLQPAAVVVGIGFGLFGAFVATLVAAPFVVNLIAAYGLANAEHRTWTVVAAILAAALTLLQFPLGTVLALHTGLVLFWDPLVGGRRRLAAA